MERKSCENTRDVRGHLGERIPTVAPGASF